jgi:hypothetical protein
LIEGVRLFLPFLCSWGKARHVMPHAFLDIHRGQILLI